MRLHVVTGLIALALLPLVLYLDFTYMRGFEAQFATATYGLIQATVTDVSQAPNGELKVNYYYEIARKRYTGSMIRIPHSPPVPSAIMKQLQEKSKKGAKIDAYFSSYNIANSVLCPGFRSEDTPFIVTVIGLNELVLGLALATLSALWTLHRNPETAGLPVFERDHEIVCHSRPPEPVSVLVWMSGVAHLVTALVCLKVPVSALTFAPYVSAYFVSFFFAAAELRKADLYEVVVDNGKSVISVPGLPSGKGVGVLLKYLLIGPERQEVPFRSIQSINRLNLLGNKAPKLPFWTAGLIYREAGEVGKSLVGICLSREDAEQVVSWLRYRTKFGSATPAAPKR